MLAVFNSARDAANTVSDIIKNRIVPRTLEFMDQSCIRAVEKLLNAGLPTEAAALLLIETDGPLATASDEIERIANICKKHNASQTRIAQDEDERAALWKVRRSLSQAVKSISPTKINEDVTVPRSKIPDLIEKLTELSQRLGQPIVNFGHAGDGNIHVNIMTDKSDQARYAAAREAVSEVFSICLSLGGTLSGEHGIGTSKADYIESEIGALGVSITKKIKGVFDPNNILNPGKITPNGG
jgi:glycolate oxidase